MKTTILQEDLVTKVATCTRFASSRIQLPVLANILLTTKKNKLIIAATNLEISISFSIGAKVDEEGSITVPAKTFSDIISNLSKGSVTLSVHKEQLEIVQEGFTSTIVGMNAHDFPSIPHELESQTVELTAEILKNILSKVLFSVSTDESRPVLNGVLVEITSEQIRFIATDGFRLSIKRMDITFSGADVKVIVPRTSLSELTRIFQDGDIRIGINTTDKQIIFAHDGGVLTSRIIDGEFPNFERIIPKDFTTTVDVSKDDLVQAIKLASVFAKDASNVALIDINTENISVRAESSTSGKQEKLLDAKIEKTGKETMTVAFNYHYLEDVVHSSLGESVRFRFTTQTGACLIEDSKDKDFIHVVMPIKT
jgi:DNA polymerase III subunit beta